MKNLYEKSSLPFVDQNHSDLDVIYSVDKFVREKFSYKHDSQRFLNGVEVNDQWLSSAKTVLEGNRFTDDCDGLAYTCAELAFLGGVRPETLMLIWVTRSNGLSDHMVAGYGLPTSNFLVFGDTFGSPVYANKRGYKVHKFRTIASPQWFENGKKNKIL